MHTEQTIHITTLPGRHYIVDVLNDKTVCILRYVSHVAPGYLSSTEQTPGETASLPAACIAGFDIITVKHQSVNLAVWPGNQALLSQR